MRRIGGLKKIASYLGKGGDAAGHTEDDEQDEQGSELFHNKDGF